MCVCVKDENVKSENMKQNRDKNRTMYVKNATGVKIKKTNVGVNKVCKYKTMAHAPEDKCE